MHTFIIDNKCLINSETGEVVALLTTENDVINNTLRSSMDLVNLIEQREVSEFLNWIANRLKNKYNERESEDCKNHLKELKKLSKDFYDIIVNIYGSQYDTLKNSIFEQKYEVNNNNNEDNEEDGFIFLKSI